MNYKDKKTGLEKKFEEIKKEMERLNQELAIRQQELFRLQGEYRLLEELETKK